MTENRFKVYKVIGSFGEWSVEDTVDDKVVSGSIMHKYEADRLCDKLNELNDENKQLQSEIENLKIMIDAKDTLLKDCMGKFNELGVLITVDDDGYVIE